MTQISFVKIPEQVKSMDNYYLHDKSSNTFNTKINVSYSIIQRARVDDWHNVPEDKQVKIKQYFLNSGYTLESEE